MYLRSTKRRNADGSEVRYYQLAENVWDSSKGCAVAKVVYNFGRADQLDHETLRRLASSILRVVSDEDGASVEAGPGGQGEPLRLRDSWPFGGVFVLERLWQELQIDRVLSELGRKAR